MYMMWCMPSDHIVVNVDSHRCMLTFTDHFGECYIFFQIPHNVDI